MTPDPDAVQVLAVLLHGRECHGSTKPYIDFSRRHRDLHEARASHLLFGLGEAGWHLTTTKEN